MTAAFRLAILTSHPVQYQAPLFRALAKEPGVDLTVFFCSDFGLQPYHDPGFGTRFRWDVPLVEGYAHRFLPNRSPRPRAGPGLGLVNPAIMSALRAGHFDGLVIYGWASVTCWMAFAAARILGIPVFLRGESNGLSEPTGAKLLIKRMLLRLLFPRTAGFLAIGSLNRRFYRHYGVDEGRIFLAPYSVDNEFFRRHSAELLPRRGQLRREEGIPEEATVFLFCGKLSPHKRPLDLLEAFALLPDVRGCFLIYAGDGVLRATIEEKSHQLGLGSVRITGFRNQSELPRWYSLADVLVVPSQREPWGLVVNEAMNFGLPIVASDQVGAAPDLVCSGDNGFTYQVGNIPELVQHLAALAVTSPLRRAMGNRSHRRILDWGIQHTVDGYCSAFRSLEARLQ